MENAILNVAHNTLYMLVVIAFCISRMFFHTVFILSFFNIDFVKDRFVRLAPYKALFYASLSVCKYIFLAYHFFIHESENFYVALHYRRSPPLHPSLDQ